MNAIIAAGLAVALLSGTALADADVDVMPNLDEPQFPMTIGAGFCQDLVLAEAYVAVQGPEGVATIPMVQTAPHSFTLARQADWPATGHFRLIWVPSEAAPDNLLTAVDVAPDVVLLDGMPVAEAFVGGHGVATAIRDVALDPASREVTMMVGMVPTGSTCAHAAMPATLMITAPATIQPLIDPGIGNGPLRVR
ncbi:MAG: hypothetical protein ACFCVH_15205 [Alphaproteobacteria bacterium]